MGRVNKAEEKRQGENRYQQRKDKQGGWTVDTEILRDKKSRKRMG